MKHAAPANRTAPTTAWAAISEDVPPQIYEVGWYEDQLDRQDLRHIKVKIIPILPNRRRKTAAKR